MDDSKIWPNRIIKKLFDIMIRLGKTFSASVQAPAAIVWVCAACKQGVNDNDGGGGGATAQWSNIVWSRIWILIPLCFDEIFSNFSCRTEKPTETS